MAVELEKVEASCASCRKMAGKPLVSTSQVVHDVGSF